MKEFIIYKLVDPRSNTPFYVGATKMTPEKRLHVHLYSKVRATKYYSIQLKRAKFIKEIMSSGLLPVLEVIERTSFENVDLRESHHYSRLKNKGFELIQNDSFFIYSQRGKHYRK